MWITSLLFTRLCISCCQYCFYSSRIEGLAQGVYRYDPGHHQLIKTSDSDLRDGLTRAAFSQGWISHASTIIVFTADFERTTRKYGKRGERYVHIEAAMLHKISFCSLKPSAWLRSLSVPFMMTRLPGCCTCPLIYNPCC